MNDLQKFFLTFSTIGVWLIIIIAFGYLECDDEEANRKEYCEMVAIWKASDLPPEKRPGWPPYNGDCE